MEPHVLAEGRRPPDGWWLHDRHRHLLVVVALVVPILLLARSIGNEAPKINDALTDAVTHTAPLAALRTTIEHATIIIGGLQRGRARLGDSDALAGHVIHRAQPVDDRKHSRHRRGSRRRGAAQPAYLPVKVIDRRVVTVRDTLKAAAANTRIQC